MPINLSTVNVGTQPTLLYGGQGSVGTQVQLINLSTAVTMWIGYNQSIMAAYGNGAIPLGPGASITFDGSVTVYGISTIPAVVAVVPGGISYSPGLQIASLFNSQGAVIISGAGQATPITLLDVSQYNSYDLNMVVVDALQGTINHSLTFNATLMWYDDLTSGIPVFQEQWNPWVVTTFNPTNTNQGIVGSGPMHGRYMSIVINNVSNFPITLEYFNMFGSPRNLQLSDWRQTYGNHINDAVRTAVTLGQSFGYENSLADPGVQINYSSGTGTYWMPINLYSGPVEWAFQQAGALVAAATIVDVGSNGGSILSGHLDASIGQLVHLPASGNSGNGVVNFPRSACAFMINVTTSGPGYIKAVAQQGP